MAKITIGDQYSYNGKGYLDAKIQPVGTVEDLADAVLTRQKFQGLTITVLHPDGPDSLPADYIYAVNPSTGNLEWMRKSGSSDTTVDTNTPDYIEISRDGQTFYVDKGAWFDRFESGVTDSLTEIYALLDELSSGVTEDIAEISERLGYVESAITETNERIDTIESEVSSFTETITNQVETITERVETLEMNVSAMTETVDREVERIDAKDAQQDELIAGIYDWRIEKTESGNTDYYALIDGSGNTLGDVIEVTNEQYLENVEYISAATEQDKEIDDSVVIGDPYLKFTWAYDIVTYVAVKTWVNDYFAGDGIEITPGHEVSVKLSGVDSGATCYLSTSDSGLELNMFYEVDE